jgi:hypothetical protein
MAVRVFQVGLVAGLLGCKEHEKIGYQIRK